MSSLGEAIARRARRGGPAATATPSALATAAAQGEPPTQPGPPAPSVHEDDRSELRRRRDALAEQVTELHWDLGGLAYEMAIRDHFRLDLLVRRAAILQQRDAELAEVERLLRLEESASAGACASCGAPHSRGAAYCWQCGAALMEHAPSSVVPPAQDGDPDGRSTAVMQALLAPEPGRKPGTE
jgi:hypothetical protein